ncbi:FixH family protein [Fulvivirga lutea]|uniref:FixH family protein n=1 Tax=Fulvivirga lutea TaxID=2810512 RepID=A0A974ZZM5_9BACT|nr:FixH family protein [Fulvivirga lutea]QSE96306.1 FixH family protein [Fulvivirga lutea]
MNWGTKIVIAFISFAGVIITMVVISMKQDISLVATDYYKQELAYQDQIDKQTHALELGDHITFEFDARDHKFFINSDLNTKGEVHFYRPSDAKKDRVVPFEIAAGTKQFISTKGMDLGLWKVKLSWSEGEKEAYIEKTIII